MPALLNVGLPGTLAPATQSVLDSNSGQLVYLPLIPGTQANPVEIFMGTWTPAHYSARTVRYGVSIDGGWVYLMVPGWAQPSGESTINTGSEASISIVPAPGGALVIGIGALAMGRRRGRP